VDETLQQSPAYEGTVFSADLSGEVKLIIDTEGLVLDSLFKRKTVAYAQIESITFADYAVHIKANNEIINISRMGQSCQWFHHELVQGYTRKVLSAFFVTGAADLETEGQYFYNGVHGKAAIHVFSDCLCILPPNLNARRVPFVFINDMKKDDCSLTITLSTGEVYSFSMLGFDMEPLQNIIANHIRKLRDNNIAFVKMLQPALGFSDGNKVGALLPEGIAVQLKQLPPTIVQTLEKKALNSKMAASYQQLKNICDYARLAVGIKALPEEEFAALKQQLLEKLNENAEQTVELTPEQEDALRWVIWAAIPSKDGKTAVVEFAFPGEDAATYLFSINEWEHFLMLLNRGMEATQMRREVFSLAEEALKSQANAKQSMLIVRTPALVELRKRFIGRVIHRSQETWKNSLILKLDKGSEAEPIEDKAPKCCHNCGGKLIPGAKFCSQCGSKI
jgi:hypothetical protein